MQDRKTLSVGIQYLQIAPLSDDSPFEPHWHLTHARKEGGYYHSGSLLNGNEDEEALKAFLDFHPGYYVTLELNLEQSSRNVFELTAQRSKRLNDLVEQHNAAQTV